MDPKEKWMTMDELAAYLKMSRTKLYQLAQKGLIPGSKVGSQWRFYANEIDRWIKDNSQDESDYVHGYSHREKQRLVDQATTLVELLHVDSIFEKNATVLEAGCGIGAQTVTLAGKNPEAHFTSFDLSEDFLRQAEQRIWEAGIKNVKFEQADIFDLSFEENSFDHVFVCFVLEHIPDPIGALNNLTKVLKPGGTLTVIEGDHGSVYFHPHSEAAHEAVQCQVTLQARAGGNALIGRQLYPLLNQASLTDVQASPRMVYVDSSKPELVEGFTRNTFTAMIQGVRQKALESGIIDEKTFDRGIDDLLRTTKEDGTFCYTFFKAWGRK